MREGPADSAPPYAVPGETPDRVTQAGLAGGEAAEPDPDRARDQAPGFIVVEGPIGVGKTSLARRLAESFDYTLLLEPSAQNPFLDRYYRDPKANALPTQLFFLLHRARQAQDLRSDDMLDNHLVADFLLEKDQLFAELTLDAEELALYQQIYASLDIHPPTPDLVIYLQAPTRVLQERIRARGIDYERSIADDYLERLAESYTRLFHFYTAAPLLIVNAAEIDPVHNDSHYEALLGEILAKRTPRQYFNPNPTLL